MAGTQMKKYFMWGVVLLIVYIGYTVWKDRGVAA